MSKKYPGMIKVASAIQSSWGQNPVSILRKFFNAVLPQAAAGEKFFSTPHSFLEFFIGFLGGRLRYRLGWGQIGCRIKMRKRLKDNVLQLHPHSAVFREKRTWPWGYSGFSLLWISNGQ